MSLSKCAALPFSIEVVVPVVVATRGKWQQSLARTGEICERISKESESPAPSLSDPLAQLPVTLTQVAMAIGPDGSSRWPRTLNSRRRHNSATDTG